jgi:hypothetical protein
MRETDALARIDHVHFPEMVQKWEYSFAAKPVPNVEALSVTG